MNAGKKVKSKGGNWLKSILNRLEKGSRKLSSFAKYLRLPLPGNVIEFWFSEENRPNWFVKDKAFDKEIICKFASYHILARIGIFNFWKYSPERLVALIVILDQFSRNMFRDDARAFASDTKALSLAKYGIERGYDQTLKNKHYKQFLYMPLMHSEDIEDQKLSVKLFTKLDKSTSKYAKMHRGIIKRFHRFPHRNKVLGRKSTKEELEYLKTNKGF